MILMIFSFFVVYLCNYIKFRGKDTTKIAYMQVLKEKIVK